MNKQTLRWAVLAILSTLLTVFLIACGSDVSDSSSSTSSSDSGDDLASTEEEGSTEGDGGRANSSYFYIPKDGDKVKTEIYSVTTYNDLPDSESTSVSYAWYSGPEMIHGVEVLKCYLSPESFNGTVSSIAYLAVADDEHRLYKTDFNGGSHIYEPYLPMPLNMRAGELYSYSYSYTNTHTGETSNCVVRYSNIRSSSISTRYGAYSDCLKFTRTIYLNDSIVSSVTWWYAANVGAIRYTTSGDGWSTTSDYKYTWY